VLGAVPPERIVELYLASDVFVLASRFEGYGMALAEAIAHGLPVVSTMAGAIPDTVPAGTGLLVPPDDTAALAQALRRPDQRSCRTTAARHEGTCSGGAAPHLARFCPAFCRRNRDGRMSGFPRTAWHCASYSISERAIRKMCDCRRLSKCRSLPYS
jgi:Glycosyl transferases group 1